MNSIFKPLLKAKVIGFFFLRAELQDYTTTNKMELIIRRIHEVYGESVPSGSNPFTPHVKFREINDSIHVVIEDEKQNEMGIVPLNIVKDNNFDVLELDLDFIPKAKYPGIRLSELQKIAGYVLEIVNTDSVNELKRKLYSIRALVELQPDAYHFDLDINNDGIKIDVYKSNVILRTIEAQISLSSNKEKIVC